MEKKSIEEADSNVTQYITDGLLKTRENETKKLVPFFMDQAERPVSLIWDRRSEVTMMARASGGHTNVYTERSSRTTLQG
jgi:hypothetical protein